MKTKREGKAKIKYSSSDNLEKESPFKSPKPSRNDNHPDFQGMQDEGIEAELSQFTVQKRIRPPLLSAQPLKILTTFDTSQDEQLYYFNEDFLPTHTPFNPRLPISGPNKTERFSSSDPIELNNQYFDAAFKGNNSSRKIKRTLFGLSKRPPEGKYLSYIFSFEMLNTILAKGRGRPYSEEKTKEIIAALNSSLNVRMKANQENDGFSNDMSSDTAIMNAINSKNSEGKILKTKKLTDRLVTVWETVQKIELPPEVKQQAALQFSQIKDKNGNDIIKL